MVRNNIYVRMTTTELEQEQGVETYAITDRIYNNECGKKRVIRQGIIEELVTEEDW
jgi:hypothetical protein